MGWRAFYPSNLAPDRAIKLLGIFAVKLDKVTTERTQNHSGTVWEYVLSGGSRNNKKQRKTTGRTMGEGVVICNCTIKAPFNFPAEETGEPPLV